MILRAWKQASAQGLRRSRSVIPLLSSCTQPQQQTASRFAYCLAGIPLCRAMELRQTKNATQKGGVVVVVTPQGFEPRTS